MPDVIIPVAPKGEKHRQESLLNDYRSHTISKTTQVNNRLNTTNSSTHHINTIGNDSSFGVSMNMTHSDSSPEHNQPIQYHHHEHQHLDSAAERILKITCIISIVAWLLSIIILSIVTESSPFWTFIGMSPLLLTIVVTYMLVDKYHMDTGFLMVFPFIFTGIFLILGVAGLLGQINYLLLATVNVILGLLFEVILVAQHGLMYLPQKEKKKEETAEKKQENVQIVNTTTYSETNTESTSQKLILTTDSDVEKFVASIEDKAKAINAVIGRVYSVRKGGSESLRKKIRIDPSHYNEFNELKGKTAAKRLSAAYAILNKIKQRLALLENKELEVFDSDDMHSLVNLTRQKDGQDKIIEVLAKNDSDPVKTYYEGAVQFCDNATKDLGEQIDAKKNEIKPIAQKKPLAKRIISFAKSKASMKKNKRR